MTAALPGPLTLRAQVEKWPLVAPFRTAAHVLHAVDLLVVTLERDGRLGRGEAAGVYYRNDNPPSMLRQIESVRATVEAGISRDSLMRTLPPGGARNAIDCALWDLEAKFSGRAAWQLCQLKQPRPLLSTFTCGADEPERMAATARAYSHARAIKLKLTGESVDAERVRAVRDARPDVWLAVDANQGLNPESLDRLMPSLLQTNVALIEQPFPIGQEKLMDGLRSQIPFAADESVQGLADIPQLVNRFSIVNIKLDKCGGLTEGLAMVRAARALGFETMVGNMLGTSLAMAPACLLGQLCQVVDLDGPVFLRGDREPAARYAAGMIECPAALWGNPDRP
jgi:L-alanine-DL-glutamate epimerase-like enolase superfamily enzyme